MAIGGLNANLKYCWECMGQVKLVSHSPINYLPAVVFGKRLLKSKISSKNWH